jgi:hypothetical protein
MTLLLWAVPLNMVLLEVLGVWLVLERTGQLCPHAHSKLIFVSTFPLVRVFLDTFTAFPRELPGLAVPV